LFLQLLISVRKNASERSESADDRATFAEKHPTAKGEGGSLAE
jgi:hypothetical protein